MEIKYFQGMLLAFSNLFTRHWCGPITASCFRGLYNKFVAGDPNQKVIYMHGPPSKEELKYKQPMGEGQFRFKPIKCRVDKFKHEFQIMTFSVVDFDPDSITAAELQMLICRIDRDYNAYITVCKFREDARRIRSLERKYKRAREKYRAAKKQRN